jgi:phospholipid/cholesterol/gamma-HCH transport system substrate-binding protein
MMEPEAKYAVVGSAVLILLTLVAAAIFWLRASGAGADAHLYTIYFERQSLEGLEPRSNVTMRGIRVGSVTGFRFSAQRLGVVEVFVSVVPTTPVLQSTRATVERHLVTGLASVRLLNVTEDSPPLRQVPPGEEHPVIAEGASTIQQVSATLTQLALRTDEVMLRLTGVLSIENQAAFTELLDNIRRLSKHADSTLAKADAAVGTVGGAASEVRAMAASVAGNANTLTSRYDALGADASASVRELSEAVRRMSADVERLTRRADALLASGDTDLHTTAQALRSAADSVGAAAARLRDPRQVLYGPAEGGLGPGESTR